MDENLLIRTRSAMRTRTARNSHLLIIGCGCIFAASLFTETTATCQDRTDWVTAAEFKREIERPLSISLNDSPLRSALNRLSQATRIGILLDRRVDPSQTIAIAYENRPLRLVLTDLATRLDLGVSFFANSAYLGPRDTTRKLATLVVQKQDTIGRLPPQRRKTFRALSPAGWPILSEPKLLVTQMCHDQNVRLLNADQFPHDIWPEVQLPEMDFASRLTMILAGFDVTFEFNGDGTQIRLVPIPDIVSIERTYTSRGNTLRRSQELAEMFPDAKIEGSGNRIVVQGKAEDHEAIADLLAGKQVRRVQSDDEEYRWTLKANVEIGGLLTTVAQRLKVEFDFPEELRPQLNRRVDIQVENATLDELLSKVLAAEGLAYQLDEEKLVVRKRD